MMNIHAMKGYATSIGIQFVPFISYLSMNKKHSVRNCTAL